jgi:hypothetical protein
MGDVYQQVTQSMRDSHGPGRNVFQVGFPPCWPTPGSGSFPQGWTGGARWSRAGLSLCTRTVHTGSVFIRVSRTGMAAFLYIFVAAHWPLSICGTHIKQAHGALVVDRFDYSIQVGGK